MISKPKSTLPIASFVLLMFLISSPIVKAQKSELSLDFHKNRRAELRQKMPNNSVAVFFSAPVRNRANDVDFIFHQDPNFFYLTGWNEPHAVLLVFNVPQQDDNGVYYEKLYVRERDARNEMWNGRQSGVEGAAKMGFDRVASKNEFVQTELNFDRFDRVLLFDFENDVRDEKNDSSDLYDLQQHFKAAINYPEHFDADRYRLYLRIQNAQAAEVPQIKRMIAYFAEQDETLLEDPFILDFLNSEESTSLADFQTRSAFLIRDYNFDIDQLSILMAGLREKKQEEELLLIKKAVQISAQGQI